MKNNRKWIKRIGTIFVSVVMFISVIPAYAAPDWNQVTAGETGSAYVNIQKIQCAYDEKSLYIHITGGRSKPEEPLPQLQLLINEAVLGGELGNLTLVCDNIGEGENPLSVQDSQLQELAVQGTLKRNNEINEIDITIPLTVLGYQYKDISEVAVHALINGNKEGECTGISLVKEEETPEALEESKAPEVSETLEESKASEAPKQSGIVLDGQFSDWEGYELAYGGGKGIDKVSMVSDGTNVYIRIIEDGRYDHCFPKEVTPIGLTSNMGKILWLNAEMHGEKDKMTLTFWGMEGAYAVCGRVDGIYNWEIVIPLSEVWSGITYVSDLSLIWPREKEPILTVSNPSYINRGNSENNLGVVAEINIDGYYEDWDSIPHTEITFGNNNGSNNHMGALYLGEDSMCVHYKMNKLYTSYMRVQYMEIKINGNRYVLQVLPVDKEGNIDWTVQTDSLSEGIHTNFGVFLSDIPGASTYANNLNGQVALTIYDSRHSEDTPGDEIEFSMSYERIEELLGIKQSEIRTVELYNPNIGNQWMVSVGTSSGPLLGVAISITAAGGLFYILSRKKRRKEDSK